MRIFDVVLFEPSEQQVFKECRRWIQVEIESFADRDELKDLTRVYNSYSHHRENIVKAIKVHKKLLAFYQSKIDNSDSIVASLSMNSEIQKRNTGTNNSISLILDESIFHSVLIENAESAIADIKKVMKVLFQAKLAMNVSAPSQIEDEDIEMFRDLDITENVVRR